jgi:hypothetical protein
MPYNARVQLRANIRIASEASIHGSPGILQQFR